MIGMLGPNRIYALNMKRSRDYLNSWPQRLPDLKQSELHIECIVPNSSGIKKPAELLDFTVKYSDLTYFVIHRRLSSCLRIVRPDAAEGATNRAGDPRSLKIKVI